MQGAMVMAAEGAPSATGASVRVRFVLLALAVGAVALRLPLLPASLPNHDAVNFALGLERFDLTQHRPHFPGYPVFLALAWPLEKLGLSAARALALPAVLLAGVSTLVVGRTLLLRAGRAAALTGASLYAVLPGLVVSDVQPMSDGLGVHLLTLSLCAALLARPEAGRRPYLLAAAGFGLLLGVRASSLPLAAAGVVLLLLRAPTHRARVEIIAVAAGAVLVWLVPLCALAGGPGELLSIGAAFTSGHFGTWGGAIGSGAPQGARAAELSWNLLAFGLGPVAAAVVGVLGALAVLRGDRRHAATLALVALPYAAWVALGQNPEKARHILPLLPFLVLAAAPAAAMLASKARVALALVPLAVIVSEVPRLFATLEVPPAVQAALWVRERYEPEQLQIYAGDETAVLRTYAPQHRSAMVRDAAEIGVEAGRAHIRLITSGVGNRAALPGALVPVARFERSPLVDRHDHTVSVYQWVDHREVSR